MIRYGNITFYSSKSDLISKLFQIVFTISQGGFALFLDAKILLQTIFSVRLFDIYIFCFNLYCICIFICILKARWSVQTLFTGCTYALISAQIREHIYFLVIVKLPRNAFLSETGRTISMSEIKESVEVMIWDEWEVSL